MSAEPRLERVFEPSRIRRGRLATSPTWYVVLEDGTRWRFYRKRDATRFIEAGCICATHVDDGWTCKQCIGMKIAPSSARTRASGL